MIKTQFGYHILQVEERQTAHTKPLSEVKADIVPVLEQQKFGAVETNYANQLAAEAKKNGIDKTAAAHGLHGTTDGLCGQGWGGAGGFGFDWTADVGVPDDKECRSGFGFDRGWLRGVSRWWIYRLRMHRRLRRTSRICWMTTGWTRRRGC